MRRGPIPDKDPNRPKVPQVAEMIRDVYRRHAAGCCLHVVVDDNNIEAGHVEFVRRWAIEHGHEHCRRTAEALAQMTKSQRARAIRRAHFPPRMP